MADKFRHLPYDVEVEQALLGAFLVEPSSYWRVAEAMRPEHFYDPLHQRLFAMIAKLCERDERVTPLTLHAAMKADPGMQEVGGHSYLIGLAQAAPALPNVRDYSKIIRELAARRQIIRVGEEAVNEAYEMPEELSADKIAERIAEDLFDVTQADKTGEGAVSIRDLALRAAQMAEDARNLPEGVCLSSGLWLLDQQLGGIYRGDVTYIGGAPNMGKTSLAQHVAFANSLPHPDGTPREEVIFFSLEMKGHQVATRELATRAKVPSDRMRRGKISADEMERVAWAAHQFPDLPYRVDASRRLSVAQMRARTMARKRRSKHGVSMIVIDHLRYIKPANPRDDEKAQLQQITSDLSDLAAELNVAVVCVAHVSREYAKRSNSRPQLSDLYGSSAIEQNADSVWFVHREIYYLERSPPPEQDAQATAVWIGRCEKEKGWAEIFAAKQRMGPIGSAKVKFDEKFTQYSDPEAPPTQDEMNLWKDLGGR